MLTTLESAKRHLGVTDGSADVLLNQLIPQVDRFLKDWLGREVEAGSYTEFLDGTGTAYLRLAQTPVTAVTNVWLDPRGAYGAAPGAFPAESLLTAGVDYALVSAGSGLLRRLNGVWPGSFERTVGLLGAAAAPGAGNVKVEYAAGYAAVPPPLTLAANELLARIKARSGSGWPVKSESYEDRTLNLAVPLFPDLNTFLTPEIKGLLGPYRKLRSP